ncbi:MAG: DUF4149 domain-containing protein [Acidobacteriota bacterium]
MPNWLHLFTNLIYHLGLAVWIGGTVALGALVAPRLFRELPRTEAGALFGAILRRFARVRLVALVASMAAAGVKHVLWEQNTIWIAVRWAALLIMAGALLYELSSLEWELEARRSHLTPEMGDDHPHRRAFQRLHERAEAVLKTSVVAALVAMFFS